MMKNPYLYVPCVSISAQKVNVLCLGKLSKDGSSKKNKVREPTGSLTCKIKTEILLATLLFDGDFFHHDVFEGTVAGCGGGFANGFDDVKAFDHFAEYGMAVVQMGGGPEGDEELRAAGIGSGIGHRQDAWAIMLQVRMKFIREIVTGAATAGSGGVAALNHEAVDYPVENDAIIESLGCKVDEVFSGNGSFAFEQFDFEYALGRFKASYPIFCRRCGRFLIFSFWGWFVGRRRSACIRAASHEQHRSAEHEQSRPSVFSNHGESSIPNFLASDINRLCHCTVIVLSRQLRAGREIVKIVEIK